MTFRFGGKTARSSAVIDRRRPVVSAEEQPESRTQRLVLTVAGSLAFSGLALLAYHYTAPFADPPSYAVTASATAVTRTAPVVVEDKAESAAPEATAAAPAGEAATPAAAPAGQQTSGVTVAAASAPAVTTETGASGAAPEPAIDALDTNDPRWATTTAVAAVAPAPQADAPAKDGPLAYAAENPASAALKRTVAGETTDDTETAAIPAPRPAVETLKPEAPSANVGRAPTRTATIASPVNLRAKGAKGARVLGVIPRGATVGLVGCDGWCEVVYGGRRGFIYKSFLDGASRAADASAAAQPRKPSKPKIVPVEQGNDIDHLGR